MIEHAKSIEEPVHVIIGGDYDQDISSMEMQHFFAELKLQDVCQNFNGLELRQMEHTHVRGKNYIDSIVVTKT